MRSLSFVAHATSSGPTSSSAPNTPRAITHTAQDNGSVQHCNLLLCLAPGICFTISFRYGGAVSRIESPFRSIPILTTAPPSVYGPSCLSPRAGQPLSGPVEKLPATSANVIAFDQPVNTSIGGPATPGRLTSR